MSDQTTVELLLEAKKYVEGLAEGRSANDKFLESVEKMGAGVSVSFAKTGEMVLQTARTTKKGMQQLVRETYDLADLYRDASGKLQNADGFTTVNKQRTGVKVQTIDPIKEAAKQEREMWQARQAEQKLALTVQKSLDDYRLEQTRTVNMQEEALWREQLAKQKLIQQGKERLGEYNTYKEEEARQLQHAEAQKAIYNRQINDYKRFLAGMKGNVAQEQIILAELAKTHRAEVQQRWNERGVGRQMNQALASNKDYLNLPVARQQEVLASFQAAKQKVMELGRQSGLTRDQMTTMWASAQRGALTFTGRFVEVQRAMAKVNNVIHSTSAGVTDLETVMKRSMNLFRHIALYQGFYAVYNTLKMAITESNKLETRLAEIQTITQSNMQSTKEWQTMMRGVSEAWGKNIMDITESAYEAASNQIANASNMLTFLTEVQKLALVGVTTSKESGDLIAATMNAYQMSMSQTEQISASFFKVVDLGRIRVDQLSQSFGDIMAPAAQLNIKLDELQAAMALITIQGVTPSRAMTYLRNLMLSLTKPTEDMKKLFAELGVTSGEDLVRAVGGLSGVMQVFADKTNLSSTELDKLIRRQTGLSGAITLTRNSLYDYNRVRAEIVSGESDYRTAVELSQATEAFRFNQLKEALHNMIVVDYGDKIRKNLAAFMVDPEKGAANIKWVLDLAITMGKAYLAIKSVQLATKLWQSGLESLHRSEIAASAESVRLGVNVGKTAGALSKARSAIGAFASTPVGMNIMVTSAFLGYQAWSKFSDEIRAIPFKELELKLQGINDLLEMSTTYSERQTHAVLAAAEAYGTTSIKAMALENKALMAQMDEALKTLKSGTNSVKENLDGVHDAYAKVVAGTRKELTTLQSYLTFLDEFPVKQSARDFKIRLNLDVEAEGDVKAKMDVIGKQFNDVLSEFLKSPQKEIDAKTYLQTLVDLHEKRVDIIRQSQVRERQLEKENARVREMGGPKTVHEKEKYDANEAEIKSIKTVNEELRRNIDLQAEREELERRVNAERAKTLKLEEDKRKQLQDQEDIQRKLQTAISTIREFNAAKVGKITTVEEMNTVKQALADAEATVKDVALQTHTEAYVAKLNNEFASIQTAVQAKAKVLQNEEQERTRKSKENLIKEESAKLDNTISTLKNLKSNINAVTEVENTLRALEGTVFGRLERAGLMPGKSQEAMRRTLAGDIAGYDKNGGYGTTSEGEKVKIPEETYNRWKATEKFLKEIAPERSLLVLLSDKSKSDEEITKILEDRRKTLQQAITLGVVSGDLEIEAIKKQIENIKSIETQGVDVARQTPSLKAIEEEKAKLANENKRREAILPLSERKTVSSEALDVISKIREANTFLLNEAIKSKDSAAKAVEITAEAWRKDLANGEKYREAMKAEKDFEAAKTVSDNLERLKKLNSLDATKDTSKVAPSKEDVTMGVSTGLRQALQTTNGLLTDIVEALA